MVCVGTVQNYAALLLAEYKRVVNAHALFSLEYRVHAVAFHVAHFVRLFLPWLVWKAFVLLLFFDELFLQELLVVQLLHLLLSSVVFWYDLKPLLHPAYAAFLFQLWALHFSWYCLVGMSVNH